MGVFDEAVACECGGSFQAALERLSWLPAGTGVLRPVVACSHGCGRVWAGRVLPDLQAALASLDQAV